MTSVVSVRTAGRSDDFWVFPLYKDQRIHRQYCGSVIPFQECMFFLTGYCLPFNEFEVGVLNHLLITPLQLHLVIWVFVKVFKKYCEYKGASQL